MTETVVALLALTPFLFGIPLLGKQLDVKQKTYDAARYSVWERTVWNSDGASNRKSAEDISLEARDRTLGSPRAGLVALDFLRSDGVTENPLWRDANRRRLLDYEADDAPINLTFRDQRTPVEIGYWLVPGIAYGEGVLGTVQRALLLDNLNLNRRAFASTSVSVGLRPVLADKVGRPVSLGERAASGRDRDSLIHRAAGAVLSDAWSARDENHLRRRTDDVTVNELVEQLESPGQLIALQALGKGRVLYGEGQFGWEPDLRPRSTVLPSTYIAPR